MALPRSASLVLWFSAAARGTATADEAVAAVVGADPRHLVVDWPDRDPFDLADLADELGDPAHLRLALPVPGDPLGVAGPPAFNTDALAAGEAVLVADRGVALVPTLDARTVVWQVHAADPPPVADPDDADRLLRRTLVQATEELAALDVASWQPEIPDLLMDRHGFGAVLPAGLPPRRREALERAMLCLAVVELGRRDDGGSRTAREAGERRRCLGELDAAARRCLVANCSDSLGGS